MDDCSTDGTKEKLKKIKGIRLVLHKRNMGKGAAIKTALKFARGEVIIIQDADFEYNPNDYKKLYSAFLTKKQR